MIKNNTKRGFQYFTFNELYSRNLIVCAWKGSFTTESSDKRVNLWGMVRVYKRRKLFWVNQLQLWQVNTQTYCRQLFKEMIKRKLKNSSEICYRYIKLLTEWSRIVNIDFSSAFLFGMTESKYQDNFQNWFYNL